MGEKEIERERDAYKQASRDCHDALGKCAVERDSLRHTIVILTRRSEALEAEIERLRDQLVGERVAGFHLAEHELTYHARKDSTGYETKAAFHIAANWLSKRSETLGAAERAGAEKRKALFVDGEFTAHSGASLPFKIECDALTDSDLAALASHVARTFPRFHKVCGVPGGGLRFAEALQRYATDSALDPILIVDDVLTTGASMEQARAGIGGSSTFGIVIFARGPCPDWITPLFGMGAEKRALDEAVIAGWKEATIAWSVCASIHREYAKGRDALFTTRQADFVKHETDCRSHLATRDAALTGERNR